MLSSPIGPWITDREKADAAAYLYDALPVVWRLAGMTIELDLIAGRLVLFTVKDKQRRSTSFAWAEPLAAKTALEAWPEDFSEPIEAICGLMRAKQVA